MSDDFVDLDQILDRMDDIGVIYDRDRIELKMSGEEPFDDMGYVPRSRERYATSSKTPSGETLDEVFARNASTEAEIIEVEIISDDE